MHLNKAALAQAIADKVGVHKKEAEDMISAFVDIVTSTLKDDGTVTIAGFGAFSAKTRAGRIGVNPQNPTEKIQIPPVRVPKFKAGLALKKALKEKQEPTISPTAEDTHTDGPMNEPEVPTAPHSPSPMM